MEYQNRKHPRLKQYDYSLPGCYFVTIHTLPDVPSLSLVQNGNTNQRACIRLLPPGEIARQQLLELEKRFLHMRLDKYVIMPTHIHAILTLTEGSEASLSGVVGAYKSLTTRVLNQLFDTPGWK